MARSMALFAIALVFLAVPVVSFAEVPFDEYGEISELRGLTKVFVVTGENLEVRKAVIAELNAQAPGLRMLAGRSDAEIALVFVPAISKGDDIVTTMYVLRLGEDPPP